VNLYSQFLRNDSIAIFLLHGVINDLCTGIRNYNRKHIPKAEFETFLQELLENGGIPISMDQMIQINREKSAIPEKCFIITFDDGFANNFFTASPVLEKYNIPAIFYITSSFVSENYSPWIDRLERLFDNTNEGEVQLYWDDSPRKFHSADDKIHLLEEVRTYIKKNSHINPDEFVKEIHHQLETPETFSSSHELDLKLNDEQIKELSEKALFTIGGHTVSHRIMSFLDLETLDFEINDCLNYLGKIIGNRPVHFSYPEGLKHCFNTQVIKALKNQGVLCCPTAINGVNRNISNLFTLRRITVL